MTENNGSAKREDPKFDGVVDELRNVLSGLGRPEPAPEPKIAAPPAVDPLNEAERRAAAPFAENGAAPTAEPLATDADFWNGNVLGWPSNADADLPAAPSLDKEPVEPAATTDGLLNDDPVDNGIAALSEPETSDLSAAAPVPNPFETLDPMENPADAVPPVPEPVEKHPEAWPLLKDAEEIVPLPPAAPASPPADTASTSKPKPPSSDPWLQAGLGVSAPISEPQPSAARPVQPEPIPIVKPASVEPPAPEAANPFSPFALEEPVMEPAPAKPETRPAADFEFELPIPGTKEEKDKPEEHEPHLDLDREELKPEHIVHVACIYPEGQEKAGQTFVNKLRETAEKSKSPMKIQAVFVSGWSPASVEPAAWAKSASLSGADAMFILTFRASANLFRGLPPSFPGGPKVRVVLIEQAGFPTLFTDILVELRRGR